jgi:hypothetical protein
MTHLNRIPDGYYAVPDPRDPHQHMTYWRKHTDKHGAALDMWPAKARYGPLLYRKDRPKEPAAAADWMHRHQAKRLAWIERIIAEIIRDLDTAAASFAELSTRCMWCARALRDPKSKLLGVGPDCRRQLGLDDATLCAHVTPLIAAAHAVRAAAEGLPA